MKESKRNFISFIGYILTAILVLTGTVIMFSTKAKGGALLSKGFENFKFFTVESNVFYGIVAIIMAITKFRVIKGKTNEVPYVLKVVNLVGMVGIALTFVTVMAFLGPVYGYNIMFNNANLFFHLICPVIALITYIGFETSKPIKFIHTLFCLIPPFVYGVFYFINVAVHNAYGNFDIDFYGFGANGPVGGIISLLLTLVASYLITLLIYFVNKLVNRHR